MEWVLFEWLILLLLVPAVIVPVVLLYGFAGCGTVLTLSDDPPAAPTNLRAKATATNAVTLTWQDNSGGTAKFKVVRTEAGTSKKMTFDDLPPPPFDDTTDLKEGTTYSYTVQATLAGDESGLSSDAGATTFPEAPSNVAATPQDVNRIDLDWTNNSKGAQDFIIQDELPPGGAVTEAKALKGSPRPLPIPVAEGSSHRFRVVAFLAGLQENVPQPEVRSLPSAPVTAKPLAFTADLSQTQQVPVPPSDYTFVLRISPARLHNSGTKVRLTVQGAPTGNVIINSIYLSRVAPAGHPYDSLPATAGVPTPGELTLVSSALLLTDDKPKPLDFVAFALDQSQDLIIAFDFTATGTQNNLRYDPAPGVKLYFGQGFHEAGAPIRSAGYVPQADPRSYLVKQIEVA